MCMFVCMYVWMMVGWRQAVDNRRIDEINILQVGRGVLISVYFEPYSSRSGTVVLKEGHNPLIRIFRRITDREGKKKSNTS